MSVEEKKLGTGEFGPSPAKIAKKKRTPQFESKYKPRGVKKIFVIGYVREVAESYYNLKMLLKLSGLDYFDFVMDFKATRTCLGMQSCAAKFSCSYCLGTAPFKGKPKLRTFQMLIDDANGYLALKAQVGEDKAKKEAWKFHSQVELPLIQGNGYVLFKVLLDELHIILGVGNKIFDDLYKAMIEDINNKFHPSVYKWAYDESIVGLKYRGGM